MNGAAPQLILDALPLDLQERVRRELNYGEQIIWVGQPNARRMTWIGWGAALFGLVFAGFGVRFLNEASEFMTHFFNQGGLLRWFVIVFALFPIIVILIGLSILSLPYWFKRMAQRTGYVITNRRALVFEASLWGEITLFAYGPERLTRYYRRENAAGGGDLIFEEIIGEDSSEELNATQRGFKMIDDVRAVEAVLLKTLRPSETPPT
jgi:hypothetical protein